MTTAPEVSLPYERLPQERVSNRLLLRQLLLLAAPILAEHVLHMVVGLTDTYLANHLVADAPAATAAVGTIAYVLWFTHLVVGSIATGSTALIARAIGARHRSLANSVCGQSATSAMILGLCLGAGLYLAAAPVVALTGLHGRAQEFALIYIRLLSLSLPFSTFMFVANACLRGAGDTLTPAISMIVVDCLNIACSLILTYGWFGMPALGFTGIAAGTAIAYVCGGLLQFVVLVIGRGGIRLHLHRLRPHWITLKRIFRIGIPSGMEGLLGWIANFGIVKIINEVDPTNVMPAAHVNAVRIEAMSYMAGFAVATATATMVGQALGMKNPGRATRCAWIGYAVGGGIMIVCGLFFITMGHYPAGWIAANPEVKDLTARCLFITGFIQSGFAAAIIFGGALRGAGDTLVVMILNLASVLVVRFIGAIFVGYYLRLGLAAIWVVLSAELFLRGILIFARFLHGGWRHARV